MIVTLQHAPGNPKKVCRSVCLSQNVFPQSNHTSISNVKQFRKDYLTIRPMDTQFLIILELDIYCPTIKVLDRH